MNDAATPPVLRIVRGTPDDAEIAALTVALTALSASAPDAAPEPMSRWADRSAGLRYPAGGRLPRPGRHSWRASALPA